MSSVSGIGTAVTPTVAGVDGTTFSAGVDRTAMDTNTFLKLLVAQLQYQDPSNPADSSQFLAQTAQFTAVEKMQQLTDLQQKVLDASNSQTATSLVGKRVTYTDVSGTARTGLVSACTLGATTPNLTVDGITVELTAVTSVTTSG
ncbi:MAG: flagellar hook capping FlgD N-terminal domain-containing protein [Kineosporiaceae bacterium]